MWKFWVSLVIGLFCVMAWLGGRDQAADTLKWPSAQGVITDSSVTESHDKDGDREKHASVEYTYAVNGKSYKGHDVNVAASGDADQIAAKYPKGKQVSVYYNPQKPEEAVLEQGGAGVWVWGAVGLGCLAYAGYVLIDRRKRRNTATATAPAAPSGT